MSRPGRRVCAGFLRSVAEDGSSPLGGATAGASPLCHVSPVSSSADNACLSSPCQNEGTCQVTPGGFRCLCLEGYIGSLCEDSPLESSTPAPPKTSATSTTRALPDVSQTTNAGRQTPAMLSPPPPWAWGPLIPHSLLCSLLCSSCPPGKPNGPDLLVILLSVFIPLAVILLLTLIILCVCRHRNQ